MSFGVKNATGTSQCIMDTILFFVREKFTLVYLGDIAISLRSRRHQVNHTRLVLVLLKEASVTIELKRCSFFAKEIYYVEDLTSLGKLEVASHHRSFTQPQDTRLHKICFPLSLV